MGIVIRFIWFAIGFMVAAFLSAGSKGEDK